MAKRIFLSPPFAGQAERDAVAQAFDSGYLAPCGPCVEEFERRLAALAGVPDVAAVSAGTAALELIADEYSVGPRDSVFCSDLTFIASISPFARRGAETSFIDASPASGNLDLDLLEEALASRAKRRAAGERIFAIAVDLYGQCCNYDRLEQIAERHEATLIVDAAEAVGAAWRGRSAGSAGAAGVYSFNGNKIVTTTGGGAVISRDEGLVGRARWRSQQSRENRPWYEHRELGRNFRLSNILGAFGIAQLDRLDAIRRRKAEIREAWAKALEGAAVPFPREEGSEANNWLSVFEFPDSGARNRVAGALAAADAETRPVWKPMHLQPVFAGARFVTAGGKPVSEDLFERGLCLPSGAGLSNSDLDRLLEALP